MNEVDTLVLYFFFILGTLLFDGVFRDIFHSMAVALASYLSSGSKKRDPGTKPENCGSGLPKVVIVGGGHAGAKIASRLDSIFDVALIDTKNYLNNYGPSTVGEILSSDYFCDSIADGTVLSERVRKIYQSCFPLHRFYLKHANVVLGSVEEIRKAEVVVRKKSRLLQESAWQKMRRIYNWSSARVDESFSLPYDILIFAIGEELPFPFQSQATTRNERVSELQRLISHLASEKIRKIAVLGGGPCGVSLTQMLSKHFSSNGHSKEFHVLHSSSSLLPSMPKRLQRKAYEDMKSDKNIFLQSRRKVVEVKTINTGNNSWFPILDKLFYGKRKIDDHQEGYAVQHRHAPPCKSYWDMHRERSLLHQLFFGKDGSPFNTSSLPLLTETTTATPPTTEYFDFVFDCTGGTPRFDSPLLEKKNEFFDINRHFNEEGYLRVNRFLQMYPHPNIFAVGKCVATSSNDSRGNIEMSSPYDFGQQACKTHSLSSSSCQVDYLFNHLLSIVSSAKSAESGFAAQNIRGYPNHNNFFHYWPPQLMIPFGKNNAIGVFAGYPQLHFATPFISSFRILDGDSGRHSLDKDREQLCEQFVNPYFYRKKDETTTRKNFDLWLENAVMTPKDFLI